MRLFVLLITLFWIACNHAQAQEDRLTQAACNSELPRVRQYLRQGDVPTERAVFCAAAYNFNPDITELLLGAGANPNLVYRYVEPLSGRTFEMSLLQYAVHASQSKIIQALLKHKADRNAVHPAILGSPVPYATTALALAAAEGKVELVRSLLDQKFDPNVDHAAAAFAAVSRPDASESASLLQLLLRAGMNLKAQNAFGQTVCDLATGPSLELLNTAGGCR